MERVKEGRPTEMKSKRRGIPVSFYVDPEELEALDQIRWRERKSMSEMVRIAMDEYIRNHSEGNDSFTINKWIEDPNLQAIPQLFSEDHKIKEDYLGSNKEDRQRRFKNAQRILQIYKDVNYEDSK